MIRLRKKEALIADGAALTDATTTKAALVGPSAIGLGFGEVFSDHGEALYAGTVQRLNEVRMGQKGGSEGPCRSRGRKA
jgi:hypothetical protein